MKQLGKAQRAFRSHLAARIIPRVKTEMKAATNSYYPQVSSCQIRYLSYLLGRFLGERASGHYVEVGAFNGLDFSNTWGLAERGWHGLLIEPIPHLAEACRRNYAHRDRVRVLEMAIGDSDGKVELFLADCLTTANEALFEEYANVEWSRGVLSTHRTTVESRKLEEVLSENDVPRGFDLLVVDVEGYETEVFASFDLNAWKPKMIIVELADTHPDLTATENQDALLGRRISDAGYSIVFKDWINTVFVREDIWRSSFDPS